MKRIKSNGLKVLCILVLTTQHFQSDVAFITRMWNEHKAKQRERIIPREELPLPRPLPKPKRAK